MASEVTSRPKLNNSSLFSFTITVVSVLVGITFLFSGLGHLSNMHLFLDSVHRYQILPNWMVPAFASTLPPLTTVCGMALITGQFQRVALIFAGLLFGCFAIAQFVQLISTGQAIDCGCFVWLEHETSFTNVVVLTTAAIVAVTIAVKFLPQVEVTDQTQDSPHTVCTTSYKR